MTQVDEEDDEGEFSESQTLSNSSVNESSSFRSESSVDEKDKDGGNVKPGSLTPSPLAKYQDSELPAISSKNNVAPKVTEPKKKQNFEQATSDALTHQNEMFKSNATVS